MTAVMDPPRSSRRPSQAGLTPAEASDPTWWGADGSKSPSNTPTSGVAAPPPPLSGAGGTLRDGAPESAPPGWRAVATSQPAPTASGPRLRVDWPQCKGHALCHELVPELIDLDEWGFPHVLRDHVPKQLEELARRAVASCPTLALRLVDPH